jgi:NAD(P)-dependent dehydrogenase (short-subunit alcohol dehydrogenase family)
MARAGLLAAVSPGLLPPRVPGCSWLADIARVAVFLASDQATGMTGTMVNVTGGMFPS